MAISIREFAILFLVKMADNSRGINFNNPNLKTAYIPFNYRERIENILCANNNWKDEFSVLINMEEYFEDHFDWEKVCASEILKVANELKKQLEFSIVSEYISITFSKDEIIKLLANYDCETVECMDHFVNLVLDIIYGREFQECYIDYTARTREKMHKLLKN